MGYAQYVLAQERFRRDHGLAQSFAELITAWDAIVRECEAGYDWTAQEYDNEVIARDRLELLRQSAELARHPEHDDVIAQIEAVDNRLRALFEPGVERSNDERWWRAGVLRNGGPQYRETL